MRPLSPSEQLGLFVIVVVAGILFLLYRLTPTPFLDRVASFFVRDESQTAKERWKQFMVYVITAIVIVTILGLVIWTPPDPFDPCTYRSRPDC